MDKTMWLNQNLAWQPYCPRWMIRNQIINPIYEIGRNNLRGAGEDSSNYNIFRFGEGYAS